MQKGSGRTAGGRRVWSSLASKTRIGWTLSAGSVGPSLCDLAGCWLVVESHAPCLNFSSPEGIMRCCAYSAATNRPLYIPLGHPGQADTAIQHFHDKLFHIQEDAMKVRSPRVIQGLCVPETDQELQRQTPLGRRLATRRQALVRAPKL